LNPLIPRVNGESFTTLGRPGWWNSRVLSRLLFRLWHLLPTFHYSAGSKEIETDPSHAELSSRSSFPFKEDSFRLTLQGSVLRMAEFLIEFQMEGPAPKIRWSVASRITLVSRSVGPVQLFTMRQICFARIRNGIPGILTNWNDASAAEPIWFAQIQLG
jgi:hypothetical protein